MDGRKSQNQRRSNQALLLIYRFLQFLSRGNWELLDQQKTAEWWCQMIAKDRQHGAALRRTRFLSCLLALSAYPLSGLWLFLHTGRLLSHHLARNELAVKLVIKFTRDALQSAQNETMPLPLCSAIAGRAVMEIQWVNKCEVSSVARTQESPRKEWNISFVIALYSSTSGFWAAEALQAVPNYIHPHEKLGV